MKVGGKTSQGKNQRNSTLKLSQASFTKQFSHKDAKHFIFWREKYFHREEKITFFFVLFYMQKIIESLEIFSISCNKQHQKMKTTRKENENLEVREDTFCRGKTFLCCRSQSLLFFWNMWSWSERKFLWKKKFQIEENLKFYESLSVIKKNLSKLLGHLLPKWPSSFSSPIAPCLLTHTQQTCRDSRLSALFIFKTCFGK